MDSQLTRAMEVFKRHMQPVKTLEEANNVMTTQEISDKFEELVGEENVDRAELCELLNSNGYVLDYVLDEFCWLIKSVK